jgi:gliding motility-associated-like protein
MIHDTIMLFDTVCQGEPYTENGFNVTSVQTSASGMLTLQDSIVEGNLVHHRILHLTVLPEYNTLLYEYISPGDTVYHDGTIYSTTGQYTISYTASNGCDSVVTLHILYTPGEEPVLQLWLPNAFSPGQNGINDEFLPVFNYPDLVEEYQMEIYNRWGNLVFRTEEMTRGWDGDGLTGGVYVCRVMYRPRGGKENVVTGRVTIFK